MWISRSGLPACELRAQGHPCENMRATDCRPYNLAVIAKGHWERRAKACLRRKNAAPLQGSRSLSGPRPAHFICFGCFGTRKDSVPYTINPEACARIAGTTALGRPYPCKIMSDYILCMGIPCLWVLPSQFFFTIALSSSRNLGWAQLAIITSARS